MKASNKAYDFIRKWEGLMLTSSNVLDGVQTIGYGHTGRDVEPGMRITKDQAETLLASDIRSAENSVNATMIKFNQSQFDALVSFTFNLGPGCLKTLTKDRGPTQIGNAMRLYCNCNGKKMLGLVHRREAETKLYFSEHDVNHFPACHPGMSTLYEGLTNIKEKADFDSREKIAARNIVGKYQGTAKQNIMLLDLLKKGKLVRP